MEYYLEFGGSEESIRDYLQSLDARDIPIEIVYGQDKQITELVLIVKVSDPKLLIEAVTQEHSDSKIKYFPKISHDETLIKECEITFYRLDRPDTNMVHHADCNVRVIHPSTNILVCSERFRSRHKNEQEALSLLNSKLEASNA